MRSHVLSLTLLLALAGCGSGATTPSTSAVPDSLPTDQIIYGLQHVMTKEGVRQAILYGDTAYLKQAGDQIDLVGVRLTFFDENGRESGDLRSETGTYDVRAGSMVAEGNAVLRTDGEGGERVLETEKLHFDVTGDRLWSDVPVVMREGGNVIRGTSFRSDARFQNVTVTRAQTSGTGTQNGRGGGVSF
jgi:LPS export ABC transporter protein LptC